MRSRLQRRPVVYPITGGVGPTLPIIGSLSPTSATQYDNEFTLTVNGSNFQLGDVVYWNAVALATTFINSSQLTAVVPVSFLYTSGVKTVNVNGTSNDDTVTVAAWTVASMTGVTAWWRADTIVENPAGFIQTFTAKVGAFTMTQGTAANRPELVAADPQFNNRPVARRNAGLAQFMVSAGRFIDLCTDTNGTMLVVGANDAVAAATRIFFGVSSGSANGLFAYSAGNTVRSRNFDGSTDETSPVNVLGTADRFEWRHDGATLYCRVHNTESSVASSTTTSGLTTAMGLFFFVAEATTQRAAEIITLNVAIGATDRIRYNNYCEDRYGIPSS